MVRRRSFLSDLRRANRNLRTVQAISRSMRTNPGEKSKFVATALFLCCFPLALHNFYAGRWKLALVQVACFFASFSLITTNLDLARFFAVIFAVLLVWDLFTLNSAIEKYNATHPKR